MINLNIIYYSFKLLKCPPPVNEIKNSENALLLMVRNIEFKNVKNEFQDWYNLILETFIHLLQRNYYINLFSLQKK